MGNNRYTSSFLLGHAQQNKFLSSQNILGTLPQRCEGRTVSVFNFGYPRTVDNACVFSHMVEITTDIQAKRDGLVIEQIFYVNGLKAEWVTWKLDS